MRIVIDMQGTQTESRLRGIGRYTLALSKSMVHLREEHEVILFLNSMFPDTIEFIRAAFAEILPEKNICVWDGTGSVDMLNESNDSCRRATEISREAFLAGLQPDVVLITSLFEGMREDATTSIGSFASQLPTAVILYDLIPMIYHDIYLKDPSIKSWHLNKIEHLRRADLLLSISASSGREAVEHLDFRTEKVVNISTACESYFRPVAVNEAMHVHLQKSYGLVRPFVLYTGGCDSRKNIEGLIRAYAAMPELVRTKYQLAIVCAMDECSRLRLLRLAAKEGLGNDDLIFTGFVSDEDLLAIYNSCKLFVFPSLHEGFGLPALEAMSCGRAVIGSNVSSIPEVIGREDALFAPSDDKDITRKMLEVLTDGSFCSELEQYGLERAKSFSWEQTARQTWRALETFVTQRQQVTSTPSVTVNRPRLAFVSPLPPAKSGIAVYSAELLPELSRHYEIELIVAQDKVSVPWVQANCPIHDVKWFRKNAHSFDRIIYQFGGSSFHEHMFDLLNEFTGVVVLHDFFLSGIIDYLDVRGIKPYGLAKALVHDHGWTALQTYYQAKDSADTIWTYPCNKEILQQALGIIVHSEYSCRLAEKWYGTGFADDWTQIPLLRMPASKIERCSARQKLGLSEDAFVVCNFGHIAQTKLNDRLLKAWLKSSLSTDSHCHLIFVGQNCSGEFGAELKRTLHRNKTDRIKITGWVDTDNYQTWLSAADVGVQLRTKSRGETSAALLDCMNYGLATIINAHGSMTELPENTVCMLPDEFSDENLIESLTALWKDLGYRTELGRQACELIKKQHCPRLCANMYAEAIERYYQRAAVGVPAVLDAVAKIKPPLSVKDGLQFAASLANNFPPQQHSRRLFLDISGLVQGVVENGTQRIACALLRELLLTPPAGWVIEPVYITKESIGYRYAYRFTSKFLDISGEWAEDDLIDTCQGDIFLKLDFQAPAIPIQKDYLLNLHQRGIKIFFVIYELNQEMYQNWLKTVGCFDGAICISQTVADKFAVCFRNYATKCLHPFDITWLQTNINNSSLTWKESAEQLMQCAWGNNKYIRIRPEEIQEQNK
jgi:glycosyltransferase involved in cell wall biosynthesis